MRLINPANIKEFARRLDNLSENQLIEVLNIIADEMSTVEAEPIRHGHWIVDEDGNIKCSECGHHGVGDNYCERCGSKMDGERK